MSNTESAIPELEPEAVADGSSTPLPRPLRSGDALITVALIVILFALVALFLVVTVGRAGAAGVVCGENPAACTSGARAIGAPLSLWGPPIIALLATIYAAVRVLRRKLAFWAPILGGLLMFGCYYLGSYLLDNGVPGV